jgi:uncharacterized protein
MIRRLEEADRAAVIELLGVAPQLNLYLLGNLESPGFDQGYCEFWGDVTDGHVAGVINRYMMGWSVYGRAEADWAGLGALVDSHPVKAERLQDNPGGIPSLLPFLSAYTPRSIDEETLMELPITEFRPRTAPAGFVVRRATLDDLAGLAQLYAGAEDMARTPAQVERPLRVRRIWMVEKDGEVVAAALTNAETDSLAMIGGVYTAPAWRGYGLSQAVCSALCDELIATGRQPALYWQNPSAGHVYTKLGFRPVGTWRSVRLVRV